jgi:hypothetical protein
MPLRKSLSISFGMFRTAIFRSYNSKRTEKQPEFQYIRPWKRPPLFIAYKDCPLWRGRLGEPMAFPENRPPTGSFPAEAIKDKPADEGISQESMGDFHDQTAFSKGIHKSPNGALPARPPVGFLPAQN